MVERIVVPADGPSNQAMARAFMLVAERCSDGRCAVLLLPTLGNVEGVISDTLGRPAAEALRSRRRLSLGNGGFIRTETPQTYRYVMSEDKTFLLGFPSRRMLDLVDGARDLDHVIVVPWGPNDVRDWIQTWNPTIAGQPQPQAESLIGNVVVEAALRSLTSAVNLSTGLSHPRDRDAAIHMFRALRDADEHFEVADVRAWALRHGWNPRGAEDLQEVADGVAAGRALRTSSSSSWRADIIELWREDARQHSRADG